MKESPTYDQSPCKLIHPSLIPDAHAVFNICGGNLWGQCFFCLRRSLGSQRYWEQVRVKRGDKERYRCAVGIWCPYVLAIKKGKKKTNWDTEGRIGEVQMGTSLYTNIYI